MLFAFQAGMWDPHISALLSSLAESVLGVGHEVPSARAAVLRHAAVLILTPNNHLHGYACERSS